MAGVSNYAIAVILCLHTLFGCLSSTISQYIYAFYLQTYSNSSNNKDAHAWAQQRSAELFFWINLMSSCPVIIMTYVLGLYTPKLGKRFVLILPMLGMTSQVTIWLTIIYFHLPEFGWFIAAFIISLSGSSGVFGLTINLIITEHTTENERSSRFVRFGAMQTALSSVTNFGIGYYIQWRGFTDLYWIALLSQILSIIIVAFFFKSADINHDERTPLLSSSNNELQEFSSTTCSRFLEIYTVFRSNHRSKKKTVSLFLTLFSNMCYILATTCFAPFLWFLLNTPFCWTSKDIGHYSALSAISSAILSLIGMQVLTYIGANDPLICIISHIFFCSSCLWVAFAQHSWQLYAGLLIGAFSNYQGTLITSMMSKWLQPHERSKVFTLVTGTNTIIWTLGNALFNWVYAHTVLDHRNLTILIAAGLSIVPFTLNICLFFISRRMSDEEIPSVLQDNTEPVPFSLQNNTSPAYGDVTYMINPCSSLISSLRTSSIDRSRVNSVSVNNTEDIINSSVNDLNIL